MFTYFSLFKDLELTSEIIDFSFLLSHATPCLNGWLACIVQIKWSNLTGTISQILLMMAISTFWFCGIDSWEYAFLNQYRLNIFKSRVNCYISYVLLICNVLLLHLMPIEQLHWVTHYLQMNLGLVLREYLAKEKEKKGR